MTTLLILLLWAQSAASDARQLLERGQSLMASQPAEAVKLLEQALRIDPELPGLRFQLGLAYHAIGDEADAEPELREALTHIPDSAEAHNALGAVLFGLGNAKAALDEFRAAARLAPKDPNAHFNLGEALARTGDSNGALDELRIASGLAPSDAGLARLMKNVETAMAAPESTIKINVRQVLVPTVVTDKAGQHVKGLTQDDFTVFEDGVEQKITGFSSESVADDMTGERQAAPAVPAVPSSAPARGAQASVPPVRRTFLVLIDTLHVSFNDFVTAREALLKRFSQERTSDSQYGVIAVGASAQVVVNMTQDPLKITAALKNKQMQKVFQDGQMGGTHNDIERFRRDLNATRLDCDHTSDTALAASCQAGLDRAPLQAQAIAEEERIATVSFLRQLRSLVEQLSRGRDRRTVVLMSDGFQISPGQEALTLLEAFFPAASHCLVPDTINCPTMGRQSSGRMTTEFEPILQLAAKSNITIDTIDARGLYGQSSFSASNAGSARTVTASVDRADRNIAKAAGDTLSEIADATGGTAFHDSNNLAAGLDRAFSDARDYYTISYVSTNAKADGKFRAIKVQVRDRGDSVNAKRGYWADAR